MERTTKETEFLAPFKILELEIKKKKSEEIALYSKLSVIWNDKI